MQKTADGGFIITGYTSGFGTVDRFGRSTSSDIFLGKVDTEGTLLWAKAFGGSQSDVGKIVQETSDGGFIITGYTQRLGSGQSNVLLLTNSVGTLLWANALRETGFESFVQKTTDGGFIITGENYKYEHLCCQGHLACQNK